MKWNGIGWNLDLSLFCLILEGILCHHTWVNRNHKPSAWMPGKPSSRWVSPHDSGWLDNESLCLRYRVPLCHRVLDSCVPRHGHNPDRRCTPWHRYLENTLRFKSNTGCYNIAIIRASSVSFIQHVIHPPVNHQSSIIIDPLDPCDTLDFWLSVCVYVCIGWVYESETAVCVFVCGCMYVCAIRLESLFLIKNSWLFFSFQFLIINLSHSSLVHSFCPKTPVANVLHDTKTRD